MARRSTLDAVAAYEDRYTEPRRGLAASRVQLHDRQPGGSYGGVCEGGALCTGNRDLFDDFGVEASPTTGFASTVYSDDQYQNDANHRPNVTLNCTAAASDSSTCNHTNVATQTAGTRIFTARGK